MTRMMALCTLAVLAVGAMAQEGRPTQPMRIAMDFARFRGDQGNVFVELYYAIPQQSLTYVRDSSGLHAGADVTLIVTRPDGSLIADRWLVPHVRKEPTDGAAGMNLVGLYPLMLGGGEHRIKVTAHDQHDPVRIDSLDFRLPIRPPDSTRVVLSDIELAAVVRQGKPGGQFYKNTLEVIPNVESVVGEEQKGWVYAEAYGLFTTEDRSDYTMRTSVVDALGKEVISREKPKKRSGESSVIVDALSVKDLRSGTYTLVLALLDSSRKVLSTSGKKFFVYNPTLGVDSSLLLTDARVTRSEFAKMEEGDLDREFSWARYMSSDDEKARFKALTGADAKRKFLLEYWSRRPEGMRKDFLGRVAFVNSSYRILGKEGYLTDRGRVYLMYGPPDDIDRHPSEAQSRPLEIWSYNAIQSGVIFVFVQRQMGGDLELVHSTHRSELQDENWERFAIEN